MGPLLGVAAAAVFYLYVPPEPASSNEVELALFEQQRKEKSLSIPKAKLTDRRGGQSKLGISFWLARYHNVGKVRIQRPSVVLELLDAQGKVVAEKTGWAKRESLEPGEQTPVLIPFVSVPEHVRWTMKAIIPEPEGTVPVKMAVRTMDSKVVESPSGRKLKGKIVNDTELTLDFVEVVVEGLNESEELVALAQGQVRAGSVLPGAAVRFEVPLGAFELEPPKTYQPFAYGLPQL